MTGFANQLEILQRIAAFSARAHGHNLTAWLSDEFPVTAACSRCGCTVVIYASPFQPDIEGSAVNQECDAAERAERSAGEAA